MQGEKIRRREEKGAQEEGDRRMRKRDREGGREGRKKKTGGWGRRREHSWTPGTEGDVVH